MHRSRMKRNCPWLVLVASTLFLACGANVVQGVRSLDGMNHTVVSGTKRDHSIVGYVVKLENNSFAFSATSSEEAVAYGRYVDPVHTVSNYGQLYIATSAQFTDNDQMFAAGFMEGWLTAERIYDAFFNMNTYFRRTLNDSVEEPMRWLQDQDDWVRTQIERNGSDVFRALGLIFQQVDGMMAGYAARQARSPETIPPLTEDDFLFINGNGDVYDVLEKLKPSQDKYAGMSPQQLGTEVGLAGRCSALLKLTPDLSEILIGHSTWDTYSAALKIFKHYAFQLSWEGVAAQRVSFSSYPGELTSDDDLYMMSSGLVMVSTTSHIYNMSIFQQVEQHALLAWQRVLAANMLARSGEQYSAIIADLNSGTYNNQYMVLDLNRFKPGEELPEGVLWIAEQVPGLVLAADATDTLLRGYWPSYNVPYFKQIYDISAYPDFIRNQTARGEAFARAVAGESYQLAPRAKIFRRDQGHVLDIASLKTLMRSNSFANDPFSDQNPYYAVCARGDLIPGAPVAKGCYDSKVTSASMARNLEADVICGMTTAEGSLPVFKWGKKFADIPHRGLPDRFDFRKFERQRPVFPEGWPRPAASTL